MSNSGNLPAGGEAYLSYTRKRSVSLLGFFILHARLGGGGMRITCYPRCHLWVSLGLIWLGAIMLAACVAPEPLPIVTSAATMAPVPSPTATPIATVTPASSPAPSPTLIPTPTFDPTPTSIAPPVVTKLVRFGKGAVEGIAWSADGKAFTVISSLGIYLYDAQTLRQLRFIDTGARWLRHVAFSPA